MTRPLQTLMLILFASVTVLAPLPMSAATSKFTIRIQREYSGNECVSGYLFVDGKAVTNTLERPWNGNIPLISSIPAGTYPGSLRYDHKDQWRIELRDVPDRHQVEIHIGNTIANTVGCILVGQLATDLCTILPGTSAPAYAKLKTLFYGTSDPNSSPDVEIEVQITDAEVAR